MAGEIMRLKEDGREMKIWNDYFEGIKDIGTHNVTEYSFRAPFENLLNTIKPFTNIKVLHEKTREKGFGAPDFRVEKSNAPLGNIETKPLNENLDKTLKSEQIERYLSLNPNLILTNYHEFMLIKNKELIERCNLFSPNDLETKKSRLKDESVKAAEQLFKNFFLSEPLKIGNSEELAIHMADRTKIVKEFIFEILRDKENDHFSKKILGLYYVFKETLVEDLTEEEFADAYAQTVLYGFFLAFLESGEKVTIQDASRLIPSSFKVIKEFFHIISDNRMPLYLKWIFTEVANLINNVDLEGIYKSISFKNRDGQKDKDPYLYFYETFLGKIDPDKKKAKGVYYTPFSVVSFITHSINKLLLSERFNKSRGFADSSVTVLDFATGTGTFLVSIFELIFDKIRENKGLFKSIVNEHILKNFYGFEYLIAPYAVAHLKLAQLLKDNDYILGEDERVQVYLTDTLDDSKYQGNLLMPVLSEEGENATEIKIKKKILVVTGNPPYNIKSRNNKKWIHKLIQDYRPEGEQNIQSLNDDYVKFIRYAHWKMESTTQGIVGIITNNSFLNGLSHRRMRGLLLKDFNEIYILNLHGSSRIEENTQEIDKNVFDIQQGVSINIFVKKEKEDAKSKVFYADLFGLREHKYTYLLKSDR